MDWSGWCIEVFEKRQRAHRCNLVTWLLNNDKFTSRTTDRNPILAPNVNTAFLNADSSLLYHLLAAHCQSRIHPCFTLKDFFALFRLVFFSRAHNLSSLVSVDLVASSVSYAC